ncbi:MAG: helix-turn-helix transcriptional regulator [Gaiellaceae bacterium]
MSGRRHHYHRGSRTRRRTGEGAWRVRARVERFGEPALLLLLREAPAHGYELLERLPELLPDERIDMGNLYRVLRSLEEDGIVQSEWDADAPGPAKRIYELTDDGRALLDAWAEALGGAAENVGAFLARYEAKGGDYVPR